jgi:hypothetical protein
MVVMGKVLLVIGALAATLMFGAAGAYFTGQAQVPENVIKAGSVSISTEPTSAAISIDALAPGVSATKPLTVVNTGDLPVTYVVTAVKKAGITEFFDALTVRVVADGAAVYEGSLAAMRTAPLALGAGARTQLQFSVGIPAASGNELAGDYTKVSLYIDAEQAR